MSSRSDEAGCELVYSVYFTLRCCRMPSGSAYPSAPRQQYQSALNGDSAATQRPAIVKSNELESMDRLGKSEDCWASGVPDVDYSQRLVFSDEEDATDKGFVNCVVQDSTVKNLFTVRAIFTTNIRQVAGVRIMHIFTIVLLHKYQAICKRFMHVNRLLVLCYKEICQLVVLIRCQITPVFGVIFIRMRQSGQSLLSAIDL